MTKRKTAAEKLRKVAPKVKVRAVKPDKSPQPGAPQPPPVRKDFEANHVIIRDKFIELIMANKRRPTIAEVAKATGLNASTIKAHIKSLKFEPLKHDLRVLTDDVLLSIYVGAREGTSADKRLWMELMEGWKPGLELQGPKGGPIKFKEMSTVSDAALLAAIQGARKKDE